ncbi:MAG: hypothetical protein AAF621_01405, partial [Pseudomonadota bacterium]
SEAAYENSLDDNLAEVLSAELGITESEAELLVNLAQGAAESDASDASIDDVIMEILELLGFGTEEDPTDIKINEHNSINVEDQDMTDEVIYATKEIFGSNIGSSERDQLADLFDVDEDDVDDIIADVGSNTEDVVRKLLAQSEKEAVNDEKRQAVKDALAELKLYGPSIFDTMGGFDSTLSDVNNFLQHYLSEVPDNQKLMDLLGFAMDPNTGQVNADVVYTVVEALLNYINENSDVSLDEALVNVTQDLQIKNMEQANEDAKHQHNLFSLMEQSVDTQVKNMTDQTNKIQSIVEGGISKMKIGDLVNSSSDDSSDD